MQDREPGWWTRYFDQDFLHIYRALLPAEEAAAEVDAAMEALALRPPARIVDLACGWGRHALELADLGFRVTGVDLSCTLLQEGRKVAAERELDVTWVCGDIRRLPVQGPFEAALILFSSLGYTGNREDDLAVLRGAGRILDGGGRLLIETMHRDLVARDFVERDWWEGPDGEPVRVEREFDAVAGVSRERLYWRGSEKYHEIRVRSATEWAALLREADFEVEEWLGGWDLAPFEHTSERLIMVAAPVARSSRSPRAR